MKKSILKILTAVMFAIMMMFSVTNPNVSISGIQLLANGDTGCYNMICYGAIETTCIVVGGDLNCGAYVQGEQTIFTNPGLPCTFTLHC